jgi:site-specific DNA recombinase
VPAIVSREQFEAAQTQLERNKRLAQRNASAARYLLQGLTLCARCGYAFSGRSSKGRAYYYCQGAHYSGKPRVCCNSSIGGLQLDEYVWRSVSELLRDPTRVLDEWLRRQQNGGITGELQQQRDESARVLSTHQRSLKRVVEAYEIGAIEIDDLKCEVNIFEHASSVRNGTWPTPTADFARQCICARSSRSSTTSQRA